jgi:hypothetical protein
VGGKLLSYPIGNILTSLYKLGTTGEDFNADLAHQLEDEANNTLALSPFELSVTKRIRYDKAHRRRTWMVVDVLYNTLKVALKAYRRSN